MIVHWELDADSYITNKILMNKKRATQANLGHASSLDLFKLYNESTLPNAENPIVELSRLLVRSDLAALKTYLETRVDIASDTLQVKLVLKDIQGTQIAPFQFTAEICPLEQAFIEGLGLDVATMADTAPVNWVSADASNDWLEEGGDFGAPIVSQTFDKGTEDLEVDITTWVQSVWAGNTDNFGLMIKFTDVIEADTWSYFLKRFGTRHSRDPWVKPKLVVTWDDYFEDDRLQFETNWENTLAIKHYSKGIPVNRDNVTCTLTYGAWELEGSVDNVELGGVTQAGWYQALFPPIDIYVNAVDLQADLLASESIELTETWKSNTEVIHTNTVELKRSLVTSTEKARDYRFSLMEMKSTYEKGETPVIRLYVRDKRLDDEPVRIPIVLPSQRVESAYYRIRDFSNRREPVVDFSYPENYTRLSSDGTGMYFTFPTHLLSHGRLYTIDIMYMDRGKRYIWESGVSFTVEGDR
jgi:hypothetical protein